MTRKERLVIDIYNLRNQIAEIKGSTIVNIEEFSQTRKFRDEAAEWKEFELKLRIEELKKNLEKAKVEAAQQEGVIEHIDGIGQLHGTWGSLAVIPEADDFEIIK